MADMNKRGSSDCDDCESGESGERGKRGKRGKRGHRGHDGATGPAGGPTGSTGAMGPTGAFDLAEGAWTLKWSSLVAADVAGVTQSVADTGTELLSGSAVNRYPFFSTRRATGFAIHTAKDTLVGTAATINLLKNGAVFASAAAPPVGTTVIIPIAPFEVFNPGDVVEVQFELPGGADVVGEFASEVTLDFQGPQGPPGGTGATGPTGVFPSPTPSNFVLKWSGLVEENSDSVTRNLADPGTDIASPSSGPIDNRYPLISSTTALRAMARARLNTLSVPATIRLLRNGVMFASFPAPASGATTPLIPLAEVFFSGDDIEVQVVIPSGGTPGNVIGLTVVVEFGL